ncbi:MAG: host attachment protein [Kiloniellales bacterium]|nr:host attachment protein [Kiloniellales bacterium]
MKPIVTWILIADGARAQVLANRGPGKGLVETPLPDLKTTVPPTRELGSDRPGRVHDRKGLGRHAMAPRVDWHEFEKARFAGEVAAALNKAAQGQAFDRLVLVAPPRTLGSLRAELGKTARARITGELAKDLTHEPRDRLAKHLADLVVL